MTPCDLAKNTDERDALRTVFAEVNWNLSEVARLLAISETEVRQRLRHLWPEKRRTRGTVEKGT